jgi:hypothetical protein
VAIVVKRLLRGKKGETRCQNSNQATHFSLGRKPGSRNKLQAVYFEELLTVYGELGVEAMRVMAKEKPVEFMKLVGHSPSTTGRAAATVLVQRRFTCAR